MVVTVVTEEDPDDSEVLWWSLAGAACCLRKWKRSPFSPNSEMTQRGLPLVQIARILETLEHPPKAEEALCTLAKNELLKQK